MAKIDRDAAVAVLFHRYEQAAQRWKESGEAREFGAMIELDRAGLELSRLPAEEDRPAFRWIPCAERTPTRNDHKDGMVLVCHDTGLIRFGAYIDGEWVTGEPIAWAPLPEPYEEEQDEQGAG